MPNQKLPKTKAILKIVPAQKPSSEKWTSGGAVRRTSVVSSKKENNNQESKNEVNIQPSNHRQESGASRDSIPSLQAWLAQRIAMMYLPGSQSKSCLNFSKPFLVTPTPLPPSHNLTSPLNNHNLTTRIRCQASNLLPQRLMMTLCTLPATF